MTVVNDGAWVAAISLTVKVLASPRTVQMPLSDGCKLGFEMRVSTMRQFSWRLCCFVHGKAGKARGLCMLASSAVAVEGGRR